jgi:hypothetical protein
MDIVCNLGAIAPEQRHQHEALAEQIFTSVLDVEERANGFAFRLPVDMLNELAQWISNERLCCPFFTFKVEVTEALWLELSGTPDVKTFIQMSIVDR